jgi:hypothetical protein
MASVTQNATYPPSRHVLGDIVMRIFTISGASGSTLATGMSGLLFVEMAPFCLAGTASLITGLTYNALTGVVTFTTGGGAMVNEIVQVLARVG